MTYTINNLSGKLILNFDKSEYLALSDDKKSSIKSLYLFSRAGSCWISRGKSPSWSFTNAKKLAIELGATEEKNEGEPEKVSFADKVEYQARKLERRAEKLEYKADKATANAEELAAPYNEHHGDIAFFTQPSMNGNSTQRAFTNYRNRVMSKLDQSFEESKRAEELQRAADIARANSEMKKYQDIEYLEARLKEVYHDITAISKTIDEYKSDINKIKAEGFVEVYDYSKWDNVKVTDASKYEEELKACEERLATYEDKKNYLENCVKALGGFKFTKEDIKPGYKIKLCGSNAIYTIDKVTPSTFTIKEKSFYYFKCRFAYISEIVEKNEAEKVKTEREGHNFKVGDIIDCKESYTGRDGATIKVEVVKTTKTTLDVKVVGTNDIIEKIRPKKVYHWWDDKATKWESQFTYGTKETWSGKERVSYDIAKAI